MNKNIYLFLSVSWLFSGCWTKSQTLDNPTYDFESDTLIWVDSSRNRTTPVAFYKPQIDSPRIIILSHGYGNNKPGSYLHYTYLADYLASKGYFVVSIHHELSGDSAIPSTGVPQIVRRPFWDRGADNILFVIQKLKKTNPGLDFEHIALIMSL